MFLPQIAQTDAGLAHGAAFGMVDPGSHGAFSSPLGGYRECAANGAPESMGLKPRVVVLRPFEGDEFHCPGYHAVPE